MSTTELWLRLVTEDDPGVTYPRLGHGAGATRREFELSDRARWVLAAIAVPRELAPAVASDEAQRRRLGSLTWSSGEIMARIPYQHRSTIKHALDDLRLQLAQDDLSLEDYVEIDTRRGCYGLRPGGIQVDVLELFGARDDPHRFDRLLAAEDVEPSRARLAPICQELLQGMVHMALSEEFAASHHRAGEPAGDASALPRRIAAIRARPNRRHWRIWLPAAATAAAITVAIVIASSGGSQSVGRLTAARTEVAGGVAHTWSDPQTAGGVAGRPLYGGERLGIACRIRGFKVQDGDVWWYRLTPRPWSGRYYATADAFYNNGRTSGTLIGSKLVDARVPLCR